VYIRFLKYSNIINLRHISIDDLNGFYQVLEPNEKKYFPLNENKISSLQNNTRAAKEDIALSVAYVNNEIAGCICMLGDCLMIPENKTNFAWLNTLWVKHKFRKTDIANKLVSAAVQLYDGNILVAISPFINQQIESLKILDKIPALKGQTFYFKSVKHKQFPKNSISQKLKRIVVLLYDVMINIFNSTSLKTKRYKADIGLFKEVLNATELENFIQPFLQKNIFKRNANSLDWIKLYPWQNLKNNQKQPHRHFVIYDDDGEIISYLMVSVINKHLKIPYVYARGSTISKVTKFIWSLIYNEQIEQFTFYHKFLGDYIKTIDMPYFRKKEISRRYYAGEKISWYFRHENDITIADGDGNCVFQ